jgi:signal peptidase II
VSQQANSNSPVQEKTTDLKQRRASMLLFAGIALLVLLASQASSYLINENIPLGNSVAVLDPSLYFTHIRNLGGVFGMAQGKGWLFAVFSFALLTGLVVYLWRSSSLQRYEYICFGFVAGGGFSNVLDRLVYGSVVDFIDIRGIPFWHYIFNTADVFIHVGLWPLLIFSLIAARHNNQ